MKTPNNRYEAPQAEIIEIETLGVLCASAPAPAPSTNGGGKTESMSMQTINWP